MIIPSDTELNRIACGISEGYLKVICSLGSLAWTESSRDTDGLGIDGYLEKISIETIKDQNYQIASNMNYRIQLKSCYSSNSFQETENSIKYSISNHEAYFNKIQLIDNALIIILRLPPKEQFSQWIEITGDYTKLQRCAYFRKISFQDKKSIIEIPKKNLLNPENLQNLFIRPKRKENK